MRYWPIVCLLSLCVLPLRGQEFPKTQDLQFWDGPTLIAVEGTGSARVTVGPKGRKPRQEFDLPPGFSRPDFFNGFFRAQELESLSNGEKNWKLHSSTDGRHWNLDGILPIEKRGIVRVHAVGGGKYLLGAGGGINALSDGREASCFALGAMDDSNVLRLRSILDLGMEEPYATIPRSTSASNQAPVQPVLNPKYRLPLLALGSTVVRSPRALVIVSARLGYLWILDTDKESPSLHLVKVFPSITEARFRAPDRMETAILGIQPRSDGHFLLATRSEKAILAALEDAEEKSISMQDTKDATARAARTRLQNARLLTYPEILWWDLDPITGKLNREEAPPGLPDKLLDVAMIRKFCFRFALDGSVEGFY